MLLTVYLNRVPMIPLGYIECNNSPRVFSYGYFQIRIHFTAHMYFSETISDDFVDLDDLFDDLFCRH